MSLSDQFKDKNVVITGAAQGICRHLSLRLAEYGANVWALSRTMEDLQTLHETNDKIIPVKQDLLDWNETEKTIKALPPMDFLINGAGVGGMQSIFNITSETFDKVFGTNVKAAVNVSQTVVAKMIEEKKSGSIVNITSIAGKRTLQHFSMYCASKAALDKFTQCMAVELGPQNIRVNSVSLGCVDTPTLRAFVDSVGGESIALSNVRARTPLHSENPIIPMEDVLNTILFVLSPLPGSMTGANVVLDGGYCST